MARRRSDEVKEEEATTRLSSLSSLPSASLSFFKDREGGGEARMKGGSDARGFNETVRVGWICRDPLGRKQAGAGFKSCLDFDVGWLD